MKLISIIVLAVLLMAFVPDKKIKPEITKAKEGDTLFVHYMLKTRMVIVVKNNPLERAVTVRPPEEEAAYYNEKVITYTRMNEIILPKNNDYRKSIK
jgi:hypothetical protein